MFIFLAIIPINQTSQRAQKRPFALAAAAGFGSMLQYTIGHAGKRQTLQQHDSRAAQGCQKKAFAPEKHGFEVAGRFDIVANSGGKCHQTARIDPDSLIIESLFNDRAAGMDKSHPVTTQPLEYKALTAKETGSEPFVKGNSDFSSLGGTQKGVFLA